MDLEIRNRKVDFIAGKLGKEGESYKVLANTYTIVDNENRVYEVNATDDVNLPKWQTTENLYVEVSENEKNDSIRPQKSSKKRKNMSKTELDYYHVIVDSIKDSQEDDKRNGLDSFLRHRKDKA